MKHLKGKIMLIMLALVVAVILVLTADNKVLMTGIILAVALVALFIFKFLKYTFSAYFKATKEFYLAVLFNKEKSFRYSVFKRFNKKLVGRKHCLCDVYMPRDDGSVAKADMLIFHETGIYVIDAKPYNCKIVGAEPAKEWKKVSGKKETAIPNPMAWNKLERNWLKSYLSKYPNAYYFSFSIYDRFANIKGVTFKQYDGIVCNLGMLNKEIMRNSAKIGTSLALSEMDDAYQILKELRDPEKAKAIDCVPGIQDTIFYEMEKAVNEYDYKDPNLQY